MGNEYYGAPTTPTSDYLAHYGVKGMKWGVRRARGNDRAMARQYAKAQRKLAKLERRAASGKKYAKRAAALGAGAAVAGGLAAVGTPGVSKGIGYAGNAFSQGARGAGDLMKRAGTAMTNRGIRGGGRMTAAGEAVYGLGKHNASGVASRVAEWGGKHHDVATASKNVSGEIARRLEGAGLRGAGRVRQAGEDVSSALTKAGRGKVSNNTLVKLGAAGVGAGLAGAAGYNAYRAATTKRAARKAAEFRREMNKQFAGYNPNGGRKRRRR